MSSPSRYQDTIDKVSLEGYRERERNKEKAMDIMDALTHVSELDRDIFLAHGIDEESFREIGKKVGLHHETVRRRFLRTQKKIKEIIKERNNV